MSKIKYKIARHYTKTGAMLCTLRLYQNLTQKEVSEYLGYSSAQFISNFERGLAVPPKSKMVQLIKLYRLNNEQIDRIISMILMEDGIVLAKAYHGRKK